MSDECQMNALIPQRFLPGFGSKKLSQDAMKIDWDDWKSWATCRRWLGYARVKSPKQQWRFIAGKIIELISAGFSIAMFDEAEGYFGL